MDRRVKRILFYMVLAVTCYGIAMFFADSQGAFVAVFAVGLLLGFAADMMFLFHILSLPWRRRREASLRRRGTS